MVVSEGENSNCVVFDSSVPLGGRIITNFLRLAVVCRQTQGQKEIFTKELKYLLMFSFWLNSFCTVVVVWLVC